MPFVVTMALGQSVRWQYEANIPCDFKSTTCLCQITVVKSRMKLLTFHDGGCYHIETNPLKEIQVSVKENPDKKKINNEILL